VELSDVIVVLVAYLLGTFPSAELVAKRFGTDITKVGSGNPGASNVIRELGWKAGMSVFLMDMAKAAIAVGIAWGVSGEQRGPLAYAAMCGAIAGHVAPVMRKFHGGKGIRGRCTLRVVPRSECGVVRVVVRHQQSDA
jgi:acyl phosphate:glycerol-3-phosphate acyltransferase